MSPDTDFDPTSLDSWDEVEVCAEVITVAIGDVEHQVRCENDFGHEPPCSGTLLWTARA